MSMEKIRLKEMSHKKLRNLCKKLAIELKDTQGLAASRGSQRDKLKVAYNKLEKEGNLLLSKAEEEIAELKRYAKSLEKTLASEARRIKGYEELNKYQKEDILRLQEAVETGNLALHVVNQASDNTPFIGELPEDLGMGVDGQLRPYREMSDAEHQAWVAREVARAMQENYDNVHNEQIEGNCIGHTTSAEVDEAVEIADVGWAVDWAKRNGHHQPEGNPEPNRMDTVRIKSADEISAENIDKHTEMVCNDIAQDKSRILNVDPMFDEINKSN